MEIVIIIGAIGSVIAYICLSTKTEGELAQKKNSAFKSSLRHNPEHQNSEEVFKVLKEANLSPCFLNSELNKQDNKVLVDTSIYTTISSEHKCNNSLIEERTQKIFEKLGHCIKSNGLLDITKLAYSFNFEIVEHKGLPDLLNGMITCDANGNQMAINNNLSKESKRYSIAYLLSTYLLYYQKQEFFSFKHIDSKEDLDASNMARLLLIPESILKTMCPDYDENSQWLAEMFEVPYNIMEQRIKEIKKLNGIVLTKKLTPSKKTGNN